MKRLMHCPDCNMFVEPTSTDINDNPKEGPYQQHCCPKCTTVLLEEKHDKLVELPNKEEVQEWMAKSFTRFNPQYRDFFYMGIEALYVKLGGDKFITVKMPPGSTF